MTNDFDMARHWPGKVETTRMASIELDLRFDLWQDYSKWVDHDCRLDLWHADRPSQDTPVTVEIQMDGETVRSHLWTEFGRAKIIHEINDEREHEYDLCIRFAGISGVPVRNDHGKFVCGMCQIESIRLQGEEITNLLPDTFFGQDRDLHLAINTPVYRFIIDNIDSIWPKQFDQVL